MNIHSQSLNFVNRYTPSAPPAAVGRAPAPLSKASENASETEVDRKAGRPHRLVQALGAALREIGIVPTAGTTSAPAGTTLPTDATATPPAPPTTGGGWDVAVQQFAHALMGALGELGTSREAPGRSGEHRQDGEHGHRGNHHGNGKWGGGYGDLAQRLESLSQSIVQTPPAAVAPSVPPTAGAPSTPPTAAAPLPQVPLSPAPVIDGAVGTVPAAAATPAPPVAATSTLLDAFSKLFSAAQPQAAADAPAVDRTSQLKQFLQTLAQELSRGKWDAYAAPRAGTFVDHCA